MNQTRFDVLQSSFQVFSDLYMSPSVRRTKGESFSLTLIVSQRNTPGIPLDIYVRRVPEGVNALQMDGVDKTKVIRADASLEPDGETFLIDVIFEPAKDLQGVRPYVRTSPDVHRLAKELGERQDSEAVQALLEALSLD